MLARKVAVIGLGYVGLPVAVAFAKQQLCIGFDINQQRLAELKLGIDSTGEVSNTDLALAKLELTDSIEQLANADFYIVAVPTPIDSANRPDLTPVEKASVSVAKALKVGDIVVYESTVYPGVTEEICVPILESISGLKCGIDFKVGYSPERINPGDKQRTFTQITKIVSGMDSQSLAIIAEVYASVVTAGVYQASSIKVAEAAKVIENTQRDLNIALMNELAVIFDRMDIDTLEVLEAAGTKWNFLPFRPGLVGGHCIGVDPYYLTYKAEMMGYIPQVIQAGRRINNNMGRFVARKAIKLLVKAGYSLQGLAANVLGFTFKEDCPDLRNSRVIDIVRELEDYSVQVTVHDPLASSEQSVLEYGVALSSWDELASTDLLVIAVSHAQYKNMGIDSLLAKAKAGALIIDVKSMLDPVAVIARGFKLWRL